MCAGLGEGVESVQGGGVGGGGAVGVCARANAPIAIIVRWLHHPYERDVKLV